MSEMTRPLEGRAALITGANQGLGLAIAHAYVAAGASVLMCARDGALLGTARAEVAKLAQPGQLILGQVADVSDPGNVKALAEHALARFPQLHILVNNAGVYGPLGPSEDVDWDAWVQAININLLGSVLTCRALLPHFKAKKYGKIIQLSGGGATSPLPRISAYAASKAAVVRFAETLAEEVRGDGIDVNAIAPGALDTRLLDQALSAGPEAIGKNLYERMVKTKAQGGTPVEKGAGLAVFLGSAASDNITGKLISAAWDPWETLPEHRDALADSDIYTLRRVTPSDRGLGWGEK
jgi:NAD(P)-dependent dehydrogenase (short-subunit alcohol dehydrogenase family)